MFPFKRFIQGPSLHDETTTSEDIVSFRAEGCQQTGEEARKAYEEIISLPSTAVKTEVPMAGPSNWTRKRNRRKKLQLTEVPKLSTLFLYCERNNYEELEDALNQFKRSIDINSVDEHGWTFLMSASCAGSLECVSVLLKTGANWLVVDKKDQTAVCLARKNGKERVCELIEEWNRCYFERRDRGNGDDEDDDDVIILDDEPEGTTSRYCDKCKLHYESAKEIHDSSIAHLVCTAQFGKDKIRFGIPESNRGFQLMVKSGWDAESGLGPDGSGHRFPVKTVLKRNKLGLGNEEEKKKARITHFAPFDPAAVEGHLVKKENQRTIRRKEANKLKCKEKRKEIRFRQEFSGL